MFEHSEQDAATNCSLHKDRNPNQNLLLCYTHTITPHSLSVHGTRLSTYKSTHDIEVPPNEAPHTWTEKQSITRVWQKAAGWWQYNPLLKAHHSQCSLLTTTANSIAIVNGFPICSKRRSWYFSCLLALPYFMCQSLIQLTVQEM